MEFKCTIDNTRSTRAGLKVTLFLEDDAETEFLKGQVNLKKMPLIANLRVDENEMQNQLGRITTEQRNKLYVLFKEISDFYGDNPEATKVNLKHLFRKAYDIEPFSLSDCTKEMASDFITFCVGWCLMNSVGLNTQPRELLENDDVYFYICVKQSKCCCCGDEANIIVGGNGKKIALCGNHEAELRAGQPKNFFDKYHVEPITVN